MGEPPPEQEPGPSKGSDEAAAPTAAAEVEGDGVVLELLLFACREAYVYRIPSASTAGHRAELWDVNTWLQEVALRVVATGDDCYVRLEEQGTGELFAEAPISAEKPLLTAVEPVVDSSRYFVLRVADRGSQRHAFIGIGFRTREQASDFNAALVEHVQGVKRRRLAEAMRQAYEERGRAAADGAGASGSSGSGVVPPQADLRIKEGEKLQLQINVSGRDAIPGGGFVSRGRGQLGKPFSVMLDERGGAVAGLSPPPGAGRPAGGQLVMAVSPAHPAAAAAAAVHDAEQQQQQQQEGGLMPSGNEQQQEQQRQPHRQPSRAAGDGLEAAVGSLVLQDGQQQQGAALAGDAAAAVDDWGDFEEAGGF